MTSACVSDVLHRIPDSWATGATTLLGDAAAKCLQVRLVGWARTGRSQSALTSAAAPWSQRSAGWVLGYTAVTLVVAAGAGAVAAGSPAILTGLTIVGGAYLMWHGAMTFTHPATPSTDTEAGSSSSWNTLWTGVCVSGLNPKGLLIFLALLPQLANPHASWPFALQIAVLGLAFTLTCAAMVIIGILLIAERLTS